MFSSKEMLKKKTTPTMCLSLIHTCLDLLQVSISKGSEESLGERRAWITRRVSSQVYYFGGKLY